jgi:hypothetical protein
VSEEKSLELRVSVDVGYRHHSVAMGLSSGEVLEEFEIDHRPNEERKCFVLQNVLPAIVLNKISDKRCA